MGSHSSPFESSDILQLFISTFLLSSTSWTQKNPVEGHQTLKYFGKKNEVCYHHRWGRHPAYADLNGEWSTGQSPPPMITGRDSEDKGVLLPLLRHRRQPGSCRSDSDYPRRAPCCSSWGFCGFQSEWCRFR